MPVAAQPRALASGAPALPTGRPTQQRTLDQQPAQQRDRDRQRDENRDADDDRDVARPPFDNDPMVQQRA
jgi:hypothetical protein